MRFHTDRLHWINEPKEYSITHDSITIHTEKNTDFWQRTYYGFRNDNAPALLGSIEEDFTFTVKTDFDSRVQFDQCGVIIYMDDNNWFKASIEYEDETFSRLGSVVTNLGYSDWATTDISTDRYRLSKRGQDFLIETSEDGMAFRQMRIFHLHKEIESLRFGVYACSPLDSSFTALFSDFRLEACLWEEHKF